MYLFLTPTLIAVTLILGEILLKIYRECKPDLSDVKPHWIDDLTGFLVFISSYTMSFGIGIKVASYLFG